MASLFIVPAFESLIPSSSSSPHSCQCNKSSRHGPQRQRALCRRRWSPFESSRLSRIFELAEDESNFLDQTESLENLWGLPSLLLHLKNHSSAKAENDSATNQSAVSDKQVSEKTEQKVSPQDAKLSDNFSVSVELGDVFKPSEISVKVTGKALKIEGKHEETGDDGHFSCRQFTRSVYLPDDVDIENLTSTLSKEGVLSVEAPRLQLKEKKSEERNIPIQQTTSPEAVEEKKSEEADRSDDPKTNPEEEGNEMDSSENEPDKSKETENS
ncbi:Alpha-crystallin B chain [Holothuria leucospilota]|uniref:Alpha-crystallin B chain n=1 Tax=Holothuria leucospilota TaxID=206669 RepID=A0A9Q1BFF8_HOLLE|nr:Alpha-crystallin B chain [Holothuria leucospilota]